MHFQLLSGLCTENPDFYQASVPKTPISIRLVYRKLELLSGLCTEN